MEDKKIIKEVLDVSLPVVLELTVYNFLYILDIMLVGKYGGGAKVAEFGICNNIFNAFFNIFIFTGICVGVTTLVAQNYGAANYDESKKYGEMGILLGILISAVISIFILNNSESILKLAGVKRANLKETCGLLKILSISLFFNMNTNVINAVIRGCKNTMQPLKISVYVAIVKIAFNLIFIFHSPGNISPAYAIGLASAISQFIGFAADYYYITRISKDIKIGIIFRISVHKIMEVLKLSIPSSGEEAAYSISRLICTFIIMRAGSVAFAANEIANSIESVSFMPGTGFGTAATTLAGINFGKRNFKKLKRSSYGCFYYCFFMMGILALVFLFGSKFLVSFFIDERDVMYYAAICLAIGAFEQPAIALSMNFSGALKGIGDTKTPFIVTLISACFIRLPLTFIFIYILKRPIYYVWWITFIEWTFDGVFLFFLFNIRLKKS